MGEMHMTREHYRYVFAPAIPLEEVEASLVLALFAVESLHGEAQAFLDAGHFLDADRRACVIDAGSEVGRDLNRVFTGFLRREFGPDAFTVERIDADSTNIRAAPACV
jgi:hypothetical protein